MLPSTSQAHDAAAKIGSLGAPYKQISQSGWLRRPDYAHLNYRVTDGGAGFYRFLAWARMKPNDVSPGHAIYVE